MKSDSGYLLVEKRSVAVGSSLISTLLARQGLTMTPKIYCKYVLGRGKKLAALQSLLEIFLFF